MRVDKDNIKLLKGRYVFVADYVNNEVIGPLIVEWYLYHYRLRYIRSSSIFKARHVENFFIYDSWKEACLRLSKRFMEDSEILKKKAEEWESRSNE
jgi:hypothetical protein